MQQFLRLILLAMALSGGPVSAQQAGGDGAAPSAPITEDRPGAAGTPTTGPSQGSVKVKSQQEKRALLAACQASRGGAEGCGQLGR